MDDPSLHQHNFFFHEFCNYPKSGALSTASYRSMGFGHLA
jgi:hypothetical protein